MNGSGPDLTAPFDNKAHLGSQIRDISGLLVHRFLQETGSELIARHPPYGDVQIYHLLNLVVRIDDHEVPRNLALLLFNEDPDRFFPGTHTEVATFGSTGELLHREVFLGPVQHQIRSTLLALNSITGVRQRLPDEAEAEEAVAYAYPRQAMTEALVNAFYHRSYKATPEPVKVHLYTDRIEITSHPGPALGIKPQHFQPGYLPPPVPARNRRLGEFLKKLRLTTQYGTGVPKIQRQMRQNGSPEARFDFDEERTYFRVILPIHPGFRVAAEGLP